MTKGKNTPIQKDPQQILTYNVSTDNVENTNGTN